MIRPYYIFSAIPAFLLLVTLALNGDFNAGGPKVVCCLLSVALNAVLCPVITLVGAGLISSAVLNRRNALGLIIATMIAALPGIILLVMIRMPKGEGHNSF